MTHPCLPHKAKISREFDSRKDSYPTKLVRRLPILVKRSFRELYDSKLSVLQTSDIMVISLS